MSTGSDNTGFCRWTLVDGAWTPESFCEPGFTCSMVTPRAPRALDASEAGGYQVGIPDAEFRELLQTSGGPTPPPSSTHFDVPCVPIGG